MPNGRVGGVLVSRDDLRGFFGSIEGDPVVGKINGTEVLLSEVKRLAQSYEGEEIFVEGQRVEAGETIPIRSTGELALVIHFSNTKWLWVSDDRPVFEGLKQRWLKWHGKG